MNTQNTFQRALDVCYSLCFLCGGLPSGKAEAPAVWERQKVTLHVWNTHTFINTYGKHVWQQGMTREIGQELAFDLDWLNLLPWSSHLLAGHHVRRTR